MYVTQQESANIGGFLTNSHAKNDKLPINKVPKQTWVKIHDLHQYIASIFVGCSMPPLDQFLQLEIQEDSFRVKLQKYNKGSFSREDENSYIYYLNSGKIYLKKRRQQQDQKANNSRSHRIISASSISSNKLAYKQLKAKQKNIQIKQDSFFMLCNIKKSSDVQYYDVSNHESGEEGCCLFGRIKINPIYGLNWYISQSSKHQFLAPLFQSENFDVSEHKLKGLSRFFKYDNFRRGTILSIENQQNQRLFIIKSGQCQYSKSFSFNQKNHSNFKILKIANGEPRSVIGSQFLLFSFLGSSKSATIATKAMSQLKNQIPRLNFQMSYQNKNNFTVTVLSAFAEIYYISIQKFKQLCEKYVPEAPQNLRKNVEGNYITLLRTTKQKLDLQIIKIERNQNKASQQKTLVQSKLMTGQYDLQNQLQQNKNEKINSPLKIRKSQFIETNLLQQQVQKNRNKRLQKKIELHLQSNKVNVDFKKRIQIILRQKLVKSRLTQSPVLQLRSSNKDQQSLAKKQKMAKDLQQIFANSQQKYNSNNVQRQTEMINKKQLIFNKRYNSVNNILIVNQQCFDKQKNKLFRMELMRKGVVDQKLNPSEGSKNKIGMKFLSQKMKKQCLDKINRANKIKEQFMTIRSQCEKCHCYDDIESFVGNGGVQKDIKNQTMRTGLAWRPSQSQNKIYQQPLQKLHSRKKLISEKTARKYHHNMHLHEKRKNFKSSQRRLSAPPYF